MAAGRHRLLGKLPGVHTSDITARSKRSAKSSEIEALIGSDRGLLSWWRASLCVNWPAYRPR